MSWKEIKSTPRHELDGLLHAFGIYQTIHAFDGYDDSDIGSMTKDKPSVGSSYRKSKEMKERYEYKAGIKKKPNVTSFQHIKDTL